MIDVKIIKKSKGQRIPGGSGIVSAWGVQAGELLTLQEDLSKVKTVLSDLTKYIHPFSSEDGELPWSTPESLVDALEVTKGLFSRSFISARGLDVEAGGGAGSLFGLVTNWGNASLLNTKDALGVNLGLELKNRIDALPTTSVNPFALTIQKNGVTVDSYDGSAAKIVNIPTSTSYITEGSRLYFTDARAQSALSGHTSDSSIHITSAERLAWNAKLDKSIYDTFKSDYDTWKASIDTFKNDYNTWKATIDAFKSLFDSMFEKDGTGTIWNIKAKKGFWSVDFISARGSDDTAGSGGSLFGLYGDWTKTPSTSDALRADLGKWLYDNKLSKTDATTLYQPKGNYLTSHQSLAAYLKIDGSNGTRAGVNTLINLLEAGTSTPVDADYIITQYVGGGTTNKTFVRRPISAVWAYIKGKTDALYQPLESGKGLSSNDFTDALLTKLNGIEAGANNYVHPTGGANTTISAANGKVLSAITVNSLGHVTSVSSKTLAATDIPSLAISKITGLQTALDAKVAKAGDTMTGLLTLNAGAKVAAGQKLTIGDCEITWDATYGGLKFSKGIYSDSFVSARGADSSGASSGGSAFGLIRTWPSSDPGNATTNALGANLGWWLKTEVEKRALSTDLSALSSRVGAAEATLSGLQTASANHVTLDTAQTITGAKTFTQDVVMGAEKAFTGYTPRKKDGGGGWAHTPFAVKDYAGTKFAHIGVYGEANALKFMYIGAGEYNTTTHTRIAANGELTAPKLKVFGGTSSQFLKANGDVDSNSYALSSALSDYLPKSGGTLTGTLNVATGLGISDATGNGLIVYKPTSWTGVANTQWGVGAIDVQGIIRSSNTSLIHFRSGIGNATIWDSGNDGAGSGLDADLLDGLHASSFPRVVQGSTATAGTKYVLLGTLPASTAATYDSFNIKGTIGSWNSGTKCEIDITVGRRDGLKYNGFCSSLNTSVWDIGVNAANQLFLILKGQYTEYNLALYAHQSSISFSTTTTPTDTDFVLLSASTTINRFNNGSFTGNAGSATKLADNTAFSAWGQTFFENGVPKTVNGDMTGVGSITTTASNGRFIKCNGASHEWGLLMGTGGENRGIYEWTSGYDKWLLYFTNSSTIFNHGNVGIGTPTPTDKLTVAGNITPSTTHASNLGSSTKVWERIYGRYIDTDSGYNLRLCAGGSEKLSINASTGYVGVNRPSPAYQFDVNGKVRIGSVVLEDDGSGNLKVNGGLWSTDFISARGSDDTAGSGGSLFGLYGDWTKTPSTSDALRADLGKWLYDNKLSKTDATTLYQPKGNYLTSHQSLAAYLKIDGSNGTADGVSALINKLTTGSSTPVDGDYFISQYVNGGTTTTTYHRRPVSLLWNYIKGKADSVYLPLTGGTLTGALLMGSSVASAPASQPTALSYGRLQCYGTLNINANTDNSGTEYVNITAGHGLSSSTADGLSIGTSTLTWQNNTVWHSGNDGTGSGLDADLLDGVHNGSLTAKYLNYVASGTWDCNEPTATLHSDYGSSGRSISNKPDGWSYGQLLTIGRQGSFSANLSAQFMWDVQHNTASPGILWFRTRKTLSSTENGWGDWGRLAFITDNVASATKATYATYLSAKGTPAGGTALTWWSGSRTVGTAAGNAYKGSSADINLWSFPDGGTAVSGTTANVMNLRMGWSNKYWADIFTSPNFDRLWYRRVDNGTAGAWHKLAFLDDKIPAAELADASVKLQDNSSFTAWGQTFFTGGKPQTVSGAMTVNGNITVNGYMYDIKGLYPLNAGQNDIGLAEKPFNNLYMRNRLIFHRTDVPETQTGTYDGSTQVIRRGVFVGRHDETFKPADTSDPDYAKYSSSGMLANGLSITAIRNANMVAHLVVVQQDGKVGVNTASPGQQFDVNGVVRARAGLHIGAGSQVTLTLDGTALHCNAGFYSDSFMSCRGKDTASDIRMKRDLRPVGLTLAQIAEAPAVTFRWKDTGEESFGSIAQYWEGLVPQAVHERRGVKTLCYGNLGVVGLIVVAREVRELLRENEELRAEVRELREKVGLA